MAMYDLSKYQTVQQRIDLFWQKYPQGRFNVEIVSLTPEQVVMKAEVWTDWAEDYPRAVDYAEERPAAKGVNATSHIENCATSVLGRAISQLGGELSPSGLKPSREEMQKVVRLSNPDGFQDFVAKAKSFKNIDELRSLYSQAREAGAPSSVLEEIAVYANGFAKSADSAG